MSGIRVNIIIQQTVSSQKKHKYKEQILYLGVPSKESNKICTMKLFTIFGFVAAATVGANGAPQFEEDFDPYNPVPPKASPGCRTVAVSEKSIIYVEKNIQVCQDYTE